MELRRMIALVDGVIDGVGTSTSLTGPAGIGKTFLLNALQRAATERGVSVRRVTADAIGSLTPLSALGALFGVAVEVEASSPDTATMSLVASAGAPSVAIVDELVTAFEADSTTPGVVIIDDAQWLDRWSLMVLRRLLRVAPQFSQLIVAAFSDEQAGISPRSELFDLRFAHDIKLTPLDSGSAIRVAQGFVGGAAIGPVLSRIVKRANGNPLHISEVMRHAASTLVESSAGVDTPTDAIPTSLPRSISYRLGRLSAELGDIVTMASLLGDRFSFADLERSVSVAPEILLARLRELEVVGIFRIDADQVAFTHSLYRQTEYERMPASVRRAAHARIANATADLGGYTSLRHRALALDGTDEHLAAELVAAALTARTSQPEQAIELMHLALALGDDSETAERTNHLASLLIDAGHSGDALDILLPEDGSRPASSTSEILASTALFLQSRHAEAAERLRRLVEVEPPAPVKALASAARAAAVLAAGSPASEAIATAAISHAVAAGDLVSESLARSCRGRAVAFRLDYLDGLHETNLAIELADRSGTEQAHRFAPYFFHAIMLLDLGRHEDVEASCAAGRLRAQGAGSQYCLPLFDSVLASLAYSRGDGETAHALAMAAASAAEDLQATQAVVWCLSIGALTELDRGATVAAAELIDRADQHFASGGAWLGIDFYYLAHARLLEQRGSIQEARLAIDAAWSIFIDLGINKCLPLLGPTRIRLARGTHGSSAVAEVVDAATRDWIGSSSPAVDATGRWCQAVDVGDIDALRSVRNDFAGLGRHRDAIGVLLDEAYLLARRGDSRGALAALRELSDSSAGHGGQILLLEREMHQLGIDVADHFPIVSGPDALTASEQDVVDLVVAGRTNAQVAEARGVSIRTVESQMFQVFGKLNVSNRAQLVRSSLIGH